MLQLELSSSGLLLGLSAFCLLIILLIIGARYYLRKKTSKQLDLPAWSRIKQLAFDPLRHNTAFFQVGLIGALALSLMAFNWTQREAPVTVQKTSFLEDDIIEVHPPRTPPPPAKVIPPPPLSIKEVPLDELPEEVEDFVDPVIITNEPIFTPAPTPRPKSAPAPPPLIKDEYPEEWVRVEKMPAFPGCEELEEAYTCTSKELLNFIYDNLKYPAVARENNVEGTVVVSFLINENGKVDDIKLLRDIGAGCGAVTLESVERLQQKVTFLPGMQQGRKVKVRYNLPIRFRLQ